MDQYTLVSGWLDLARLDSGWLTRLA